MVDSVNCDDKITRASRCLPNEGLDHSFKTRPGYRPGQVIGSWVRWVDPGQPKKKQRHREDRETCDLPPAKGNFNFPSP